MGTLMAAFRTLWAALVGLYEETLVLLLGNLAALALNLPLGLALFLIGARRACSHSRGGSGDDSGGGSQWLLVAIAWLLPFLPTPGNVAPGRPARTSRLALTRRASVQFRRQPAHALAAALQLLPVSLVILLALVANVYFYAVLAPAGCASSASCGCTARCSG